MKSKINQKQLELLPSLLQKCTLGQLSQRGITEKSYLQML
jgi:hypothetical protein